MFSCESRPPSALLFWLSADRSIWLRTAAPTNQISNDINAVEVGLKFTSDQSGYISAVQFYKLPLNTGTHVGSLWSSTGTLLAQATFTNETASGWQQMAFATPVALTANSVYVASYHTNVGNYAVTFQFSDGHATGIYSFEKLRGLCSCSACAVRPS